MASPTIQARDHAEVALERACEHLLSLQDAAGWWQGELQTNVTMDAEDMLLREFLGIRKAEETERSAAWIRSQQRADGTWSNFFGGPGELSTTIEAYWALRLAGDRLEDEHMRAAARFVRSQGGLQGARVFTHLWLALFGLWSWERVPALPPETVLLPSWAPLNIYDFACWARQTIVALSLVKTHRPVHALSFDLAELRVAEGEVLGRPRSLQAAGLRVLDRVLRAYERRPIKLLRRMALTRAERWIVQRQEADGSWGGIQPPWVYSLIALNLCGYPLDHPVMKRGLEGIDGFMVEDRDDSRGVGAPPGASRRLEACQSPVWDTALAIIALNDAGLPGDHPDLVRATEWLLAEELTTPGDWSVARPRLQPGGWAFEFANENYPDVDDTTEVVLALRRVASAVERSSEDRRRARPGSLNGHGHGHANGRNGANGNGGAEAGGNGAPIARISTRIGEANIDGAHLEGAVIGGAHLLGTGTEGTGLDGARIDGAIERAASWVQGMQSREGGWGAFDAENTRTLVRDLPFLDFGEVLDAPSADVTAHALEMLAELGMVDTEAARRSIAWLIERQEPGGSWFGRWGVNHVYGTGAAVPALIAAGVDSSEECIRHAVRWLVEHQNDDGGWGEDPRSYDDPAWIGRGPSTASQTAWALLALHAAGERSSAVRRGVDWLVSTQRDDGGWDEPQYTGTGFPSDYYINYHLYRLVFPIMALGRCGR